MGKVREFFVALTHATELPKGIPPAGRGRTWYAKLAARADLMRETALQKCFALAEGQVDQGDRTYAEFSRGSDVRKVFQEYGDRRQAVGEVSEDFDRIENWLDTGYPAKAVTAYQNWRNQVVPAIAENITFFAMGVCLLVKST